MLETLNSKKKGDVAFKNKDFSAAIECYTQVRNPLSSSKPACIFLSYLVSPFPKGNLGVTGNLS